MTSLIWQIISTVHMHKRILQVMYQIFIYLLKIIHNTSVLFCVLHEIALYICVPTRTSTEQTADMHFI